MNRAVAGTLGGVTASLVLVPVLAHAGHAIVEAAFFAPPVVLVVTATVRSLRAQHHGKRSDQKETP